MSPPLATPAPIATELHFALDARPKPRRLTVGGDLRGLYLVLQGRKSSPSKLNPGKSVDDQMADLERWTAPLGMHELARILEDVQGASRYSKVTTRSKWEECLRIIRTYDVAVLAVWELSRSSRRLRVFGELMETLQDRGVLLMVSGRLYDPQDANDAVALGINAVMDENMVARSRAATKRGLRSSAAAGKPHGSPIYGYRRVYDPLTRALVRVDIIPAEAKIVREVFDRVTKSESAHSIAKLLTNRGVLRPRKAKRWYPAEIRTMIECPQYIGKRSHTDGEAQETTLHEGIWDAIVSPETQRLALLQLNARHKPSPFRKEAKYLLTSIIKCAPCKDRMHGNRQGGNRAGKSRQETPMVYHCPKCRRSRNMEKVDTVVIDVVSRWIQDPEVINRLATRGKDTTKLDADRAALVEARAELAEAYSLGLKPAGVKSFEDRLTPVINNLEEVIAEAEFKLGSNAWTDLATGAVPAKIPEDLHAARAFLARLVVVKILPAGRGVRFHPDQVVIEPTHLH